MGEVVNVYEAKTHLSRLLERVRGGEVIILAKGGKPCAKLVPLDADEERKPGLLGHLSMTDEFFEPLPEDDLTAWEAGEDPT